MSLTAALNTALSGLTLAQRALGVTAHNITNAGTDGYARKALEPQTRVVAGQGRGVFDTGPARALDQYLAAELRLQQGRLAADRKVADAWDQAQALIFGTPGDSEAGLTPALERLRRSLEGLANTPERAAQRLAVIGAVGDLFARLADSQALVHRLRADRDQELAVAVGSVNAALTALDQINAAVSRYGPTADLLDQRDRLIGNIAREMDVHVQVHDNGTVELHGPGGAPLLDGAPRVVVYRPASNVGPTSSFSAIAVYRPDQLDPSTGLPFPGETGAVLVSGGVRAALTPELMGDSVPDADQVITSHITTGRIAGLLGARDDALPRLADMLGEISLLATHVLNAAHNAAVAVPPPNRLVGTRTDLAGWSPTENAGTAYLAVIDRVTNTTLATVAIDVTVASVGDVITQLNAGLGALGTASLNGDGALQIDLVNPAHGLAVAEGDSVVAFADPTGRDRPVGFAHAFGLNDLIARDATTGRLAVRADIAADPARLATARLDVDPGPPPVAVLGGAGDNRGAQALAAALDRPAAVIARGGLPAGNATLGDYVADVTAQAARAAASAQERSAAQGALVDALALRHGAVAGVNLDEELARLLQYQQAYAVAARLISVTDELLDELIGIAR
jgi:flagellar hook-associated protein 1 FlgK